MVYVRRPGPLSQPAGAEKPVGLKDGAGVGSGARLGLRPGRRRLRHSGPVNPRDDRLGGRDSLEALRDSQDGLDRRDSRGCRLEVPFAPVLAPVPASRGVSAWQGREANHDGKESVGGQLHDGLSTHIRPVGASKEKKKVRERIVEVGPDGLDKPASPEGRGDENRKATKSGERCQIDAFGS